MVSRTLLNLGYFLGSEWIYIRQADFPEDDKKEAMDLFDGVLCSPPLPLTDLYTHLTWERKQ